MISCFKGNFRITSPRGWRKLNGVDDFHKGLDLVGIDDTTVYSVSDGVVRTAYQANGAGYYVVVTMADGRRIFYMHLAKDSFKAKTGEKVKKGQPLGIMGNTGNSFGAHTHIELRPAGTTGNSLDICEFLKLPNTIGTYYYKEMDDMKFKDVPETHWAYKAIEELADKGIINGYEDGTFKPDEFITRAEVATLISKIKG